jgi:hypothetical protein
MTNTTIGPDPGGPGLPSPIPPPGRPYPPEAGPPPTGPTPPALPPVEEPPRPPEADLPPIRTVDAGQGPR